MLELIGQKIGMSHIFSEDGVASPVTFVKLYDNCVLTVSGYYHIRMDRLYSALNYYPEDAAWVYNIQYRTLIQKS